MSERIVSIDEMRSAESLTMTAKNISEYELIEIAGKALFDYFLAEIEHNQAKRIMVLAGTGNNGGDALVFARHAQAYGFDVAVFVIGDGVGSASMQRALQTYGRGKVKLIVNEGDVSLLSQTYDYIVDGIFGTGISRSVAGIHKRVIEIVNQLPGVVIAIDIPSGIDGETGLAMGSAINADLTAVIGMLKKGNLLNDALDHSGSIKIVDIGLSNKVEEFVRMLLEPKDVVPILEDRKHRSHKYDYGSVLIIGGSPGMMGAPQLAAMASLRAGAGLATVAVKEKDSAYWSQVYSEIMFGFFDGPQAISGLLMKKDFCIFGPGLGKRNKEDQEIFSLLVKSDVPLLVDAGGLDYLMEHLDMMPRNRQTIITPHAGEMARMLGITPSEIERDPELHILKLAAKGIIVVLKGPITIIADEKHIYYTKSGNPGMASGGTGDVLAGIIAAFSMQGHSLLEAAKRGVIVHGKAAEISLINQDEASLTASDILLNLGRAITQLKQKGSS